MLQKYLFKNGMIKIKQKTLGLRSGLLTCNTSHSNFNHKYFLLFFRWEFGDMELTCENNKLQVLICQLKSI